MEEDEAACVLIGSGEVFPSPWGWAPNHGMLALVITSHDRHPKEVAPNGRGDSRNCRAKQWTRWLPRTCILSLGGKKGAGAQLTWSWEPDVALISQWKVAENGRRSGHSKLSEGGSGGSSSFCF